MKRPRIENKFASCLRPPVGFTRSLTVAVPDSISNLYGQAVATGKGYVGYGMEGYREELTEGLWERALGDGP